MRLEAAVCPECGTELSGDLWGPGLCPHCSLLLALDLATDAPTELAEPQVAEEAPTLVSDVESLSEGQVHGERYRIRSPLGRGGMGEVWRAFDLKLRLDVALKCLRLELAADHEALAALRQEVRTAREVLSPNACRVFDLEEIDGQELVSMEYVDGETLQEILRNRGPLELNEAREIASQFLAGLEAIHAAGLVHRDIKPENLMITRTGRVVVMDFGIAKGLQEGTAGTIAGTPAYMSPEQARGQELDPRADLFSAGIVLAEMVEPAGVRTFEDRKRVWDGIRRDVPEVSETPWAKVIARAVAPDREERYASATALARALEEVTLRAAGDEDARPYPGLAAFTAEDSDYFFGRELEVEALLKKLRRPQLLAVIGPSGAGKSSFLRAGLLPSLPPSWGAIVATPGNRPFTALASALAEVLPRDRDTVAALLRLEEPEVALGLIAAWRREHQHVLIVLDQFEELFTQNPPEVQAALAELLGRLPVEADVHVLLAMRDDFLFHCSDQPALSPMFSELTPLRPPSGSALRRALVQPALKCGYRFEDESLAEEMLAEVEGERGSLPMVAFAAARLWQLRDHDRGLLTREAYGRIGGVAGALAQHAEQTLERIGADRIPIVRELFRNLVTAQGTRAARTREELLSVFGDGDAGVSTGDASASDAGETLDALIAARLLTAYEVPAEDDEEPQQRVEIIHESLLSNWPRMVRWRAQDEEGALLRDQLRQAAQMWEKRGRPEDLLWTGTSYNEYELWRERYSGGLSAAEESFVGAMKSHAETRKRRRRMMFAAVIMVLAVALGVVGTFWRQAAAARDQAQEEQRRATASQLLALAQLELETSNSGALAYALASLEHADSETARLFALDALWRGPTAFAVPTEGIVKTLDFSPDGQWLATGVSSFDSGLVELWPRAGGEPRVLGPTEPQDGDLIRVRFGPESDRLVAGRYSNSTVEVWSVPDGELIRSYHSEDRKDFRLAADAGRFFTFTYLGDETEVRSWPLDEGEPEVLGNIAGEPFSKLVHHQFSWMMSVDRSGSRLAWVDVPWSEGRITTVGLDDLSREVPRTVGPHSTTVTRTGFHPDGVRLGSADFDGGVQIWDLTGDLRSPSRVLTPRPAYLARSLRFDRSGSRLAVAGWGGRAALWDLDGPPDAEPQLVHRGESVFMLDAAFDPESKWLATSSSDLGVTVYPVERRYPLRLNGHLGDIRGAAFLPDGSAIATAGSQGTLRLWPLSAGTGKMHRVLLEVSEFLVFVTAGPNSENLLTLESTGKVWLVPVDGREPRSLIDLGIPSGGHGMPRLALGSRTAAVTGLGKVLLVDLDSGEQTTLEPDDEVVSMTFTPGEDLILSTEASTRIFRLEEGRVEMLSEKGGIVDLTPDGRFLLISSQGENREAALHDLEQDTIRPLDAHGLALWAALDPGARIAVTTGFDAYLRVSAMDGGPPHLLPTADSPTRPLVSPDGLWIAALDGSHTLTLWPVPDLSQAPLHTLPLEELLTTLRSLTNLRVVPNADAPNGWTIDHDPFPGWEEVPTW